MKKITVTLGLILAAACISFSQSFEGTIRFALTINMGNMSEEEQQQLKAFMPTSIDIKVKGKKSLTSIKGGMMASEILSDDAKKETYLLKRAKKTAFKMPAEKTEDQKSTEKPTVTKTTEKETVAGYVCEKYIIEFTSNGEKVKMFAWATTEIKDLDNSFFNGASSSMGGMSGVDWSKDVKGIVLKYTLTAQGVQMTSTCTEIAKGGVADADVSLPADYVIKELDPMDLMKEMMGF